MRISRSARALRGGQTEGSLVLGGRRVKVQRPRARSIGGQQLSLPSWQGWSARDPLDERALDQMVLGISTRRYARSLEPLGASVGVGGTSKSAVSERFVAGTEHKLAELMGRELSGFKLAVLMIDGAHFAEHVVDRVQWTIRLRKRSRARKGSAGAHLPSGTLSLTMRTCQRPIPRHETRSLASCGSSGWGSKVKVTIRPPRRSRCSVFRPCVTQHGMTQRSSPLKMLPISELGDSPRSLHSSTSQSSGLGRVLELCAPLLRAGPAGRVREGGQPLSESS
jgi:hypothetical protein